MKLTPKIILEGTRLTHKTDIAFALNEHPRIVGPRKYRYHSPLVSAEWCGFTNFPWGRGLINFEPQEEALAMDTYHTWVRLFQQLRYYSWIVDRFHISTQTFQFMQRGKSYDFAWMEQAMQELNFRLVFCTRSADSFAQARVERIKVSGKPSQCDDLQAFVREQEVMQGFVSASRLQTLNVDISDDDVDRAVESIADWMEQTGGLYTS
jgi:nitrogen regulatory protein PII